MSDFTENDRLLIKMLRDPAAIASTLTPMQWLSMYSLLIEHGISGPLSTILDKVAPAFIVRMLQNDAARRRAIAKNRAQLLEEFAKTAQAECLRFLVIKGMALSKQLYGDESCRDSSDIDIIVAPDDIPKADYVARKAGWSQPAEAYLVRRSLAHGDFSQDRLRALESPFALRSNDFLPHLTNYYIFNEQSKTVESLEIHDRFHLVDSSYIADMIWMSDKVDIFGKAQWTPRSELAFLLSALSLHDDAETVRSNTVTHGDLGLKTCIDVHFWLQQADESPKLLSNMLQLAKTLHIHEEVQVAIIDTEQLFGERYSLASGTGRASHWKLDYITRTFNSDTRAKKCSHDVLEALHSSFLDSQQFAADGKQRFLPTASSTGMTVIKASSTITPSGFDACWELPRLFCECPEKIVCQCVVICENDGDICAKRVNVFQNSSGSWTSDLTDVGAGTIITNANKIVHGVPTRVTAAEHEGALSIICEIPFASMLHMKHPIAILSVHDRITGQLFRRIAGYDLVELAERALQPHCYKLQRLSSSS